MKITSLLLIGAVALANGSSRKERDTAQVWASSIREILNLPLATAKAFARSRGLPRAGQLE